MSAGSSPPVRVIEPPTRFAWPNLPEVWEHRDLLYLLARREVSARYKQSAIGIAWAVVQPVLLAVVFSVFFGKLAKVPSERGVPYPAFAVSGMVLWLFFAGAMSSVTTSTVANRELISRVYFPRILIPLAAVAQPLADFTIAFVVVLLTLIVYGVTPPIQIFLIPLAVVLALTTALGIGLWLSAINVRYRDVHLAIPFLIMVGLFVSPITYPFHLVPDALRPIYALNPLVGVLETYRWMLFPTASWPGTLVLIPIASSLLLVVTGAMYFQRTEHTFADII
ncbi:MAG TPA: ABC transporter permease [Solirubrobacteraceae bacterium]|jgi:lipopolysaccharide transport system permease protein|nr:ABC transporter permease [Solirubrobacteraceae bacterium]